VQDRLERQVAASIARDGVAATAELLGKLAAELALVPEELKVEAARHRRWAADIQQQVAKVLEEGGAELLVGANPQIGSAVTRGVQALEWQAEAQLRDLAGDLIPDLVESVVKPLATAVRHAGDALAQEEVGQVDGQPSAIALWPAGEDVPQRLLPAPNEFVMVSPDEYYALLVDLIRRTTSTEDPGGALRQAVMQIVLDTQEPESESQHLIERTTKWVPQDPRLHADQTATPTRATFRVNLEAEQLLTRSKEWTARPGTAIGTFTRQGLREFLDPAVCDPGEHSRRLNRFEGQFVAALNAASPLVDINTGVLVQVHERHSAPADFFFTEIPFPDRSPGRAAVRRVLQARGLWSEEVEKTLGDGPASSIEVFSVLREPYHPVVFDSLMRPIASEWGARSRGPDLRSEFWRWRRARPLAEFLPMSPAIRRAMIRGWFTASLLGQLELDTSPMRIYVPTETGSQGSFLAFPSPSLVGDLSQSHQLLPAVLESILLAMVEVNTRSSLLPMRPYLRLRELGRSGHGGEYEQYEVVSGELEAWLVSGQVADGAPEPPTTSGTREQDPRTRKKAVQERLDLLRDRYANELFPQVHRRRDVFDVPGSYELRSDILTTFEDLARAVRHLPDGSPEGPWI
jgi:hypothetical protein